MNQRGAVMATALGVVAVFTALGADVVINDRRESFEERRRAQRGRIMNRNVEDRGRAQPQRGVTLTEILLALLIFLVAGGAILGTYLSANRLADGATETMMAVNDLEAVMEHVHATSFSNLLTAFPAGVADGGASDYSALIGGYRLSGEQITVTYPVQAVGRLEVLATATWQSHGRQMGVTLSTMRTSG
ncbi:MAG: type II secretion system protein [Candidatus Omnitrophica bacterium]|nr:type II secretion system protein [Candidatus Omnitrophota bacterium]